MKPIKFGQMNFTQWVKHRGLARAGRNHPDHVSRPKPKILRAGVLETAHTGRMGNAGHRNIFPPVCSKGDPAQGQTTQQPSPPASHAGNKPQASCQHKPCTDMETSPMDDNLGMHRAPQACSIFTASTPMLQPGQRCCSWVNQQQGRDAAAG